MVGNARMLGWRRQKCSRCRRSGNFHAKKLCVNCYRRQRYRLFPHVRLGKRQSHEKWAKRNKHRIAEWDRVRKRHVPAHKRLTYSLKFHYGLSLCAFRKLKKFQRGLCAICGRRPSGGVKTKRLHVDHDHKLRVVRGLLCGACNARLGWIENRIWMRKAKNYLARPPAKIVLGGVDGAS